MPERCSKCLLPHDTVLRDDVRLSTYDVLVRCEACSHIIIYRSGGHPLPSETEVAAAMQSVGESNVRS